MNTTDAYDLNTVAKMMEARRDSADIFEAAARALAEATGFRWAFISRFRSANDDPARNADNPGEAELLAAWTDGQWKSTDVYDLHRTPCEVVSRTGEFQLFHNVAERFRTEPELAAMGARVYAGEVYYGPEGRPMGHVFVLHDSDTIDAVAVRRAVRTVRDFLGAELRLLEYRDRATREHREARTDALTGIGNRRAFQEDLDLLRFEFDENAHLHLIDLDGMKRVRWATRKAIGCCARSRGSSSRTSARTAACIAWAETSLRF